MCGSISSKIKNINPDYIFINSGIDNSNKEDIFNVNTYGPLKIIEECPKSKIIVVGSVSYKTKKKNDYYAESKKALMLEANKYENTSIAQPGIINSKLFIKRNSKGFKKILLLFVKPFMNKPDKSCLSLIMAMDALKEANTWIGPRWFNIFGYPKKTKIILK